MPRTIAVLVLALAGCVVERPVTGPTPSVAPRRAASRPPPHAEVHAITHEAPPVHVEWIELTLPSAAAASRITETMRSGAEKTAKEFLDDARKARREPDLSGMSSPDQWELKVTCRATLLRPTLVSIRCDRFSYSGGAHGMEHAFARTFHIRGEVENELSLADLFAKPHVPTIDAACMEALRRNEADWVIDGTLTTVADLLHTWNVTSEGLRFAFDPYETGSYAQGTAEVLVKWARISPLIRRPGPLDGVAPPP